MAIVVETLIPQATKEQSDLFDASIEAAMMRMGGPPDGLMVHFARPEAKGFLLCNVWRSEADMRPFYDDVIHPSLADMGLESAPSKVSPVWTFARP